MEDTLKLKDFEDLVKPSKWAKWGNFSDHKKIGGSECASETTLYSRYLDISLVHCCVFEGYRSN